MESIEWSANLLNHNNQIDNRANMPFGFIGVICRFVCVCMPRRQFQASWRAAYLRGFSYSSVINQERAPISSLDSSMMITESSGENKRY